MANRFWVGGSATWDGTAGSKWATTSGGASGAAAPTTSDDVFLDAASGAVTVTLASGAVCSTLDCSGFTGTLSHPSLVAFTVAGLLYKLVAGMTFTTTAAGATARIDFTTTSGTCLITTAGKSLPGMTFNGVGGTWQLQDALTILSTQSIILTNGSLDTNGQTCSWGVFSSSNSNTRVLTLGASAITLTGGGTNTWECATSTNMTLNAGTSSITINPAGSGTGNFSGGGKTYYDLSVIKSGGGLTISGSNTFRNLTQNNTVLGGGNRRLTLSSGTTQTINGTLTYIGNGNTGSNRGLVVASTYGTAATIALGASGAMTASDADFRDITVTGTATPITGTRFGDCKGNSGITFDTPRTLYWVGNGGGIDDSGHWSTTSGGSSGATWPLPQDTALFDANSFSSGSQSVSFGAMRVGTMNFTGVTNSPALNFNNTNGAGHEIYGDLIYGPTMSITVNGAAGGFAGLSMNGRGTHTYNQQGIVPPSNFSGLTFNPVGGSYTLQGDLVLDATRTLGLGFGTFDAAGFNLNVGLISSTNSNVRTISMGSGTWTLSGTGTVWQTTTGTNLTLNAGASTIVISDTSSTSKTLARHTGAVLNNVTITGGGTGAVIFSNATSSTMNDFTVTGPKTLTFNRPATYTITGNFNVNGTAGNLVTITSNSAGNSFTLSKASGVVSCDYLSLQDSAATGGALWYAGLNSTNVSGNTGWIFTNVPTGGTMPMMGV